MRNLSGLNDEHACYNNGVTEEDINTAHEYLLGEYMALVEEIYTAYGPPDIDHYQDHMKRCFAIGFGAGYRRAHIDASVKEDEK